VDLERRRWTRGAGAWERTSPQQIPSQTQVHQLHLVSQGYPVRIQRALVAAGLALALAVAGALAASQAGGAAVPTSEQSGGISTTQAS